MNDANQRAYLEAMDIPVWIRKEFADQVPDFASPGLKLGPGSSQILLVCSGIDEPAKRISADIARSLNAEPVWAWPEPASEVSDLKTLVGEQLFTTVLVFGELLATKIFGTRKPGTLGSARLLLAASLAELEGSPTLRRELWKVIDTNHLGGKSTA